MLGINIEFAKGVLFVRLDGTLNNKNVSSVENTVTKIINDGGLRYLVFNVNNLVIDGKTDLFEKCKKLVGFNDGKMLVCGLKNDIDIDNHIKVNDELTALRMLSVC